MNITIPRCLTLPVAAMLILLLSHSLSAADFSDGDVAYKGGDYQLAAEIWKPLAEAGNPRAQFALGSLYDDGLGVAQNHVASSYWFERAAEQGLAIAQFNLGNAYKFGLGVTVDVNKAMHWWSKAAEQDMASAQYNLGIQHYLGEEVEANELEGVRWLNLAADNGHPEALEILDRTGDEAIQTEQPGSPVSTTQTNDSGQTPAASSPASGNILHGPEWLREQSPDKFTIQLIALTDRESIRRFIEQYQLRGQLAVFAVNRADRELFILVSGIYPDRISAETDITKLPEPVRNGQPWLRPIGDIQQMIQNGDSTS